MGTTENFCLRWNDFESNLSSAFRELRDDADFFDVTLATDEDEVKAHKVVLSACSPHLKQVICLICHLFDYSVYSNHLIKREVSSPLM